MERVAILLENERRAIANLKVRWKLSSIVRDYVLYPTPFMLQIENLTTRVVMKTSYTEVSVTLQDIVIDDMNPETIHPTVRS